MRPSAAKAGHPLHAFTYGLKSLRENQVIYVFKSRRDA
jgi:hypothetical protein